MKGSAVSEFRVVAKPEWLERVKVKGKKRSVFYEKLVSALKFMDDTKCIQLTPAELPTSTVQSFKATFNRVVKRENLPFWVMVYHDKVKGMVYIWKRPKLSGSEKEV